MTESSDERRKRIERLRRHTEEATDEEAQALRDTLPEISDDVDTIAVVIHRRPKQPQKKQEE